MHKYIITLMLIGVVFTTQAQTKDSVSTGTSNLNDVYYSFANGVVKTQPNTDWDLAFEITGFAASILANHVKGIDVYMSPYSYAKWSNFDTSGFKTWKKMYNSSKNWSEGAFNLHHNDLYDLGWGAYEPTTHVVTGDSVFLIKLSDGSFKKIAIVNLASGIYNIKYANVDGSNETTKAIDKAKFKNKNFAYYSFATENTIDREPETANWDIVFTKYLVFIPTPYPVGGVWTNKGAKTAEAKPVDLNITSHSSFTFTNDNSEIGYDWKTYNMQQAKYEITDSLVYFVNNKDIYTKLVFTGYKGGAEGKYYFTKQGVAASIYNTPITSGKLFPNPANNYLQIELANQNHLIDYQIYNLCGQAILKGNTSNIDISNLNAGMYLVKIQTEQGVQTLKFNKTAQ